MATLIKILGSERYSFVSGDSSHHWRDNTNEHFKFEIAKDKNTTASIISRQRKLTLAAEIFVLNQCLSNFRKSKNKVSGVPFPIFFFYLDSQSRDEVPTAASLVMSRDYDRRYTPFILKNPLFTAAAYIYFT